MSSSPETSHHATTREAPPSKQLFSTLITANHILHYHHVVDAYGHISVRNPHNPNTFFMSKSLAPALISSRADIQEYHISDASPVASHGSNNNNNNNNNKGYQERFIHSEIYKRYSDVHSVVHAHNEAVLPFSISSVPLQPVYHMAGVIGTRVPVFEIADYYQACDDHLQAFLVNNEHLGAGLAAEFHPSSSPTTCVSQISNVGVAAAAASASAAFSTTSSTSTSPSPPAFPPCPVVLMRGHGFTNVGRTIEEAVFRAVFTCKNAQIQTTSLVMQSTFHLQGAIARQFGAKLERGGGGTEPEEAPQEGIKFLSEREAGDSWTQMQGTVERPWGLWCEEVRSVGLYRNEVRDGSELHV